MSYCVYKHTAPNGKVYIGITGRDPETRWHGGSGYRNNNHFFAAIKKYGWQNIKHEIIVKCLTKEQACLKEIELIAKYDSADPEHGYNVSKGGDKTTLGYHFSEEARKKIGEGNKGKTAGRQFTEEHRQRISKALTGRQCTNATREKLKNVLGDRFKTPEAMQKQKENTPRGTKHHSATAVVCIETGECFGTIQEAANAFGLKRSNISACCRGLQDTAGGHRWQYYEKGQAAAIEALRLEVIRR